MPFVSVIVPNYNHARYLPQRLDSIFNQTFQDFEVILLDDCSTDNSREILEKYRNHQKVSHVVYNEKNSGSSYKQWYKGISYAKGELIWIAESDDLSDDKFLENLVPFFETTNISLVFCRTKIFYEECDIVKDFTDIFYEKLDGNEFIRKEMIAGNKVFNSGMALFKREKYMKVKDLGFSRMKISGDWLLWTMLMHENEIVIVENELNYFRKHLENTSSKFRKEGLDFLEGLIVFDLCKNISNNDYDKKKVYESWYNYLEIFKKEFNKGVMRDVLRKIFYSEPLLFFYIMKKYIKIFSKKIKTKSIIFIKNLGQTSS